MSKKAYIVGDPAGEWSIIKSNFVPENFITMAPVDPLSGKLEQKDWLVLVESVDPFGVTFYTAVVDTAAKDAYFADIEDEKSFQKDKDKKIKDLKNLIKDFKKSDLTDLSSVRDSIENIIEYIKTKENI